MSEFKFSKYNILFTENQRFFVYNTLSTAIAQLDEETYSAFLSTKISKLNTTYIDAMIKQHFIVDKEINETEEYLFFYNSYRFGRSAGVLSLTIVPTYNCNLACTYCMQGQNKTQEMISSENTSLILSFAESQIINSRKNNVPINKIHVGLYGGEPMLHKSALIQFSEGMKDIADKYNCPTHYSMTSNMTLLDDEMIALIKKFNVSVQISIDGSQENHDRRRIKKDGTGTYNTIIENIIKLNTLGLKDNLVIRINIDKDNLFDAEKVLADVHEYANDVYFGFLDSFAGLNDSFSEHCVSRESYSTIVTKKFDELSKKYGFQTPARFGKQSPCTINSINKYFIDLHLDVYKCEMLLNKPDARVGYISRDGKLIAEKGFYHQMNHNPSQFLECIECKLLPMCAGGCAGKIYVTNKRKDGMLTERNCMYTESAVVEYLKSFVQSE